MRARDGWGLMQRNVRVADRLSMEGKTMDRADIIRRAEAIYESRLKADLESAHLHHYVAIEPDSGDYFLGQSFSEAGIAARKAHPDRRSHIMRIGHRAAVHIGAGWS